MDAWETNMKSDMVYKHDYLDTWVLLFLHVLHLLDWISYFHNNMCISSIGTTAFVIIYNSFAGDEVGSY